MGRTVRAVITIGNECLGVTRPFSVDVPWWAEVTPVLGHLERVLGVPMTVVRLLCVEDGEGGRDGQVTYHVEAWSRPAPGLLAPCTYRPDVQPLRLPWATADGLRTLLDWAAGVVPLTGRPEQRKTWNLAALFRLPTRDGVAWLKATPPFAADEAAAIATLAAIDPGLVPTVLAAEPGRMILADVPGEDCWQASEAQVVSAITRLVAAQALVTDRPAGVADRRPAVLAELVDALLDGPVRHELTADEIAATRALRPDWQALADCGLPDTLAHGDFHPGNWRSDGGPPVVLDFSDAQWGNPVLDGLRAIDFLHPDRRPVAATAWVDAWTAAVPAARPAEALRLAEPLAHLAYAVRYQEFLDGIEPSERAYHHGDPAVSIRAALASTRPDACALTPVMGGVSAHTP